MSTRINVSLRSAVRRALLIGAGAAGITSVASAQTADSATSPEKLQTVVVTGTRISRVESEGALPVQVVTEEQIERTGAVNPEQFLQTVSVAVQGNNNTVAATGAGALGGADGAVAPPTSHGMGWPALSASMSASVSSVSPLR